MTDNPRETGSARGAGPAREQVVIKDKRKIDANGRAKGRVAAGESAAADASGVTLTGTEETMGQPGTPANGAKAPSGAKAAGAEQSKGKTSARVGKGDTGKGDSVKPDLSKPDSAKPETGKPEAAKSETPKSETPKPDASKSGVEADRPAGVTEPEAVGKPSPAEAESATAEVIADDVRSELDELIRDLQRVSAEYANYRKRVERDRTVMAEQAIGSVISSLLPILDDLDRARDHGDLVGPFGSVAEQLTSALAKFGLTGFGEQGDTFDPTRHEAVAHQTSADVTEPTCVAVMRRGYLLGERLLRPAMVAVAEPE